MTGKFQDPPVNGTSVDSFLWQTRQVYNLLQDLWNRLIILEGDSPFGANALQTDNHTGLVAVPDA